MSKKRVISAILILMLINWQCFLGEYSSNDVYASDSINEFDNNEISQRIQEYIDDNFEFEAEVVDTVEDMEIYKLYEQNQNEDLKLELDKINDMKTDEIKELDMYIEFKHDDISEEEVKIFTEEEFIEYIEENEIELDDNSIIQDCSWKGGEKYRKISSDGYMKLTFTSARYADNHDKYMILLNFYWLKQPYFAECNNYLAFGHDSNVTVDNDSISFWVYHYKEVGPNVTSETKRYKYGDKNIKVSISGLKVEFPIGPSVGLFTPVAYEERYGLLSFDICFVNKYTNSSQFYFMYFQPIVNISQMTTDAISIASGGAISVSSLVIGDKYSFSNEFVRK